MPDCIANPYRRSVGRMPACVVGGGWLAASAAALVGFPQFARQFPVSVPANRRFVFEFGGSICLFLFQLVRQPQRLTLHRLPKCAQVAETCGALSAQSEPQHNVHPRHRAIRCTRRRWRRRPRRARTGRHAASSKLGRELRLPALRHAAAACTASPAGTETQQRQCCQRWPNRFTTLVYEH